MNDLTRRVIRSAGFYPITGLYLSAVLILLAVVDDYLSIGFGIVVLGFVALLSITHSMWKELRTLHALAEIQHEELGLLLRRKDRP